ncbi:MAG: M28 family peptidase [Gemmatimonadota bacterium]|nr:M28 family peptidase [Gemmatimonadota bacterium]
MKRLALVAVSALAPVFLGAQATSAPQSSDVVPYPSTTLPLKHTPQPTTADITAQDLMTRLYIFADDSMQGREAGTIGNVKGTDYIASEARKMGLIPAGDNGTWFQTIPLKVRSVDPTSSFRVGSTTLAYGTEWVATGPKSLRLDNVQLVYGGVLGDSSQMIAPGAGAGKIVVFSVPPGASGRATRGAAGAAQGAVAVAIVGLDQFMPFFTRPQTFVDDPSNAPAMVPPPTILLSRAAMDKLLVGAPPLSELPVGTVDPESGAIDLKLSVTPTAYPARNVVGIVRGSDPKLSNEYVALGGHNDHIGFTNHPVDHDSLRFFNHIVRPGGAEDGAKQATPEQQAQVNQVIAAYRAAHPGTQRADSISNGADDDGSGSVSVLEIAEKVASLKTKPKRSILFVWHVGEEKGLLGSAYYTDHPTVPRDSIVAQLNIDMVGRGDTWDMTGRTKEGGDIHGKSNYLQLVGSRRLSTELGNLAETVNTNDKHGLVFDYSMDANGHPQNIYCRSDHYEYARYNIPIIFFTTGGHSDYHQVTDEPQYIDYPHMARVDNFIEDLLVHVADLDHRPVVDGPHMDPHGVCRQ